MGVHDLNFRISICDPFGFHNPGVTYERGQDAVCASDGVRAVEDFWTHRRPAQWRCGSAHAGLRRRVSRDGIFSIDVARVVARYRVLSFGQRGQTVSHGLGRRARSCHALERTEPARLAHLSCTGPAPDRARSRPLHPGPDGRGARRNGLCAGLDDHRPVLEPVRLGAVSFDQGGGEDAHAVIRVGAGFAPGRGWICAARFQPSSTSATARWATSRCSTSCPSKPVPST